VTFIPLIRALPSEPPSGNAACVGLPENLAENGVKKNGVRNIPFEANKMPLVWPFEE